MKKCWSSEGENIKMKNNGKVKGGIRGDGERGKEVNQIPAMKQKEATH
jgi:hypothetical protein